VPVSAERVRVYSKCAATMVCSLTLRFERKRYAALVWTQSWRAKGMLSPGLEENCSSNCSHPWRSLLSGSGQAVSSCSIHSTVSLETEALDASSPNTGFDNGSTSADHSSGFTGRFGGTKLQGSDQRLPVLDPRTSRSPLCIG
jgi:hypothetical protein